MDKRRRSIRRSPWLSQSWKTRAFNKHRSSASIPLILVNQRPQIHHLPHLCWRILLCVPKMLLTPVTVPASVGNDILIHQLLQLPNSTSTMIQPPEKMWGDPPWRNEGKGCKYFPRIRCYFVVCHPFVLCFFFAFVFDIWSFTFLYIRCSVAFNYYCTTCLYLVIGVLINLYSSSHSYFNMIV